MPEQPLILSLKPNYADLVFRGLKKAELRRRLSAQIANRDVFIYVSSPVKRKRYPSRLQVSLAGVRAQAAFRSGLP